MDEIKYEKVTIDSHGVDVVLARGQEAIQTLASLMLQYLEANEAPNWFQAKLHDEDGQEVIVTIRRSGGETAEDQVVQLKRRITELEEKLCE